jgi:hypothetical protein
MNAFINAMSVATNKIGILLLLKFVFTGLKEATAVLGFPQVEQVA